MKVSFVNRLISKKKNYKNFKDHVNPLIKNFSNDWKKSLELINQEIMRSFTNFKNGQAILQVSKLIIMCWKSNLCFG